MSYTHHDHHLASFGVLHIVVTSDILDRDVPSALAIEDDGNFEIEGIDVESVLEESVRIVVGG